MIHTQGLKSPYQKRQAEIISLIAHNAESRTLLEGSLWFHNDVRNNFYYASYLFAAAVNPELPVEFDREQAKGTAERVLLEVLSLQNQQLGTKLYGHWPLGLHPVPQDAPLNELPVEIMGSLMAYFFQEYGAHFSVQLKMAFDHTLEHIYNSGFFRKPVVYYNHHEAKYTAAKLIFGTLFDDQDLREDGLNSLKTTLQYIKSNGMPEYGALPWFWHWVQAFTCALEITGDSDMELKNLLCEMLDFLWNERASFYLKGAWVGPHSRGWPHDIPGDGNLLHDYIQFGDFVLPKEMPRTEYAGFLFYEAPASAQATALKKREPIEVKKLTHKVVPGASEFPKLHSYTYVTPDFAAGGLWERGDEFDNEQLRWSFSLPVSGEGEANQLFFFHPGDYYYEGDPRHQSGHMEVLYHRNVIMALFPVSSEDQDNLVGVLPKGKWIMHDRSLFGQARGVYFAIYLSVPYELIQRNKYIEVAAKGLPGGVVVEAIRSAEAEEQGILGLEQFADAMKKHSPEFNSSSTVKATYTSWVGNHKLICTAGSGIATAEVDGAAVSFDNYTV
ncbi:hypothetical protein SAMN05661091_3915 [Paenibacillus uliginis N3/975]|uniref:Heparinase II/III-like protein n=1 Tax=Paenibacillus uliginis N3/975 TaxID=1313296 RepID=A0A1X7HL43_9BACL|nr:hypothetical protein [Paenibacillus uliginis]SMF87772.1 hypothetical protein SAMN05661091_3915 [Paenibacillus uliginis N3/975]